VGVTGTSTFIEELAPTPPWTLHAGVGWAFDSREKPPVVREVVKAAPAPTPEAPKLARLRGLVHDAAGAPVANARVRYEGKTDLFPLATNEAGTFGDEVPSGEYAFTVEADGYAPATCNAKRVQAGAEAQVDCALEAAPRRGALVVTVRDLDSGAPVAGASVRLTDAQRREAALVSDAAGAARFEGLPAGPVRVVTSDDKHLALAAGADVGARETTRVDWTLRPRPDKPSVVVGANGIRLSRSVEFDEGGGISSGSTGLLAELADALVRHPELRRVEVGAHTDIATTPDRGHAMTDQRAEAVRAFLITHGVAEDRVVAKGYGSERPLAPNVTAANRARNRRIELVVLERDQGPVSQATR
jgi:outer membrane protein OmpA-like peptidoglycan-associated protein